MKRTITLQCEMCGSTVIDSVDGDRFCRYCEERVEARRTRNPDRLPIHKAWIGRVAKPTREPLRYVPGSEIPQGWGNNHPKIEEPVDYSKIKNNRNIPEPAPKPLKDHRRIELP